MQKFRLNLEDLEVESFGTVSNALPRSGTVFGHDTAAYEQCTGNYYSCDATCGGAQTKDDENTCNMVCYGGGGTGGDSMHTACLNCYTQAYTCETCQTRCPC